MDKELTEPKWVIINRPKIPQMPPNFRPNLGFKIGCSSSVAYTIAHFVPLQLGKTRQKNKEIDEQLLIALLFLSYILF